MKYLYTCEKCKKDFEMEIAMKDYAFQKDKQTCPKCNSVMRRVIEWRGIAEGSGAGWCGKSTGKAI